MDKMLEIALAKLIDEEKFAFEHIVELHDAKKDFWRMSCNYRYELQGMASMILKLFGCDAFDQANKIIYSYQEKVFNLM